MADSDFWRELAVAFGHPITHFDFPALRHFSKGKFESLPSWELPGNDEAVAEFNALARRAGSKIATSPADDLTVVWLDALWVEATTGPIRQPITVINTDETTGIMQLEGKVPKVFRASSTLCMKFESKALQAEFDEKQSNNPRNWTQFRQQYEAFNKMRELHNEPAERIPEEFVRGAIARIQNIKPEDVTDAQIKFEVAGLLSATRRRIEFIPTPRQQEQPPEPEHSSKGMAGPSPEPSPTSTPPSVAPAETIAAQLQRLRMECNWTIEKLAGKTGFDEKTVKRHLTGRAIPRLGNLTIYQRAFTKALKREIVIEKTPPKRPPDAQ